MVAGIQPTPHNDGWEHNEQEEESTIARTIVNMKTVEVMNKHSTILLVKLPLKTKHGPRYTLSTRSGKNTAPRHFS